MALWAGSSINSNATAMVFNQLARKKLFSSIRQAEPLIHLLMGEPDTGFGFNAQDNPFIREKIKRSRIITGEKYEVRHRGAYLTGLATVADGAAEYASATPDYNANKYGGMEFALAHYAHQPIFPSHEIDRFAGDEAKTLSYIGEEFDGLMEGKAKEINTQINGANNCSRTQVGGWPWAVSDGVSTGETGYASYGTIDRSDSANSIFRGVNTVGQGTLTEAAIRAIQNQISVNGGNPTIAPCGLTVYDIAYALVSGYAHVTYDEKLARWGSRYFGFRGMNFLLESRAPSGTLGLLDPESWTTITKDKNFTETGIMYAPWLTASHVLNYEFWFQFVCERPKHNGKITGITA